MTFFKKVTLIFCVLSTTIQLHARQLEIREQGNPVNETVLITQNENGTLKFEYCLEETCHLMGPKEDYSLEKFQQAYSELSQEARWEWVIDTGVVIGTTIISAVAFNRLGAWRANLAYGPGPTAPNTISAPHYWMIQDHTTFGVFAGFIGGFFIDDLFLSNPSHARKILEPVNEALPSLNATVDKEHLVWFVEQNLEDIAAQTSQLLLKISK